MANNKNKKSVKFQGDMLNFCDFIRVFVSTTNHYLNPGMADQYENANQFSTKSPRVLFHF